VFPPGWIGVDLPTRQPDPEGPTGWGWSSFLLPYAEQRTVHNLLDFRTPLGDFVQSIEPIDGLKLFRCPSDTGTDVFTLAAESDSSDLAILPTSNYVGNFGTPELEDCEGAGPGSLCVGNGAFNHNTTVRWADFPDGLSQTLLVGERSSKLGYSTWMGVVAGGEEAFSRILGVADHPPNHPTAHFDDFGSFHPQGTQLVLGDGSVHFIHQDIDIVVYQSLATRAGGEVVPES
jgi:hypothetical protein